MTLVKHSVASTKASRGDHLIVSLMMGMLGMLPMIGMMAGANCATLSFVIHMGISKRNDEKREAVLARLFSEWARSIGIRRRSRSAL